MGVLDAFMSTWSTARSTFGQGAPQTGAQYDRSAKLTELQERVNAAAPDGRCWLESASIAVRDKFTVPAIAVGPLIASPIRADYCDCNRPSDSRSLRWIPISPRNLSSWLTTTNAPSYALSAASS
jgi:hypothetical protein